MEEFELKKKRIVLLATGGTIAGSGTPGITTDYQPGTIDVTSLIQSVPGLDSLADITGEQIANVNSDDITIKDWFTLVNRINTLGLQEDIDGFVITHGTDTLEETAFFLNLTVKIDKPVVITGSMRPATALSADGPFNLYQAVALASSDEAKGMGVLTVYSDAVFSARYVQKVSTFHTNAFSSDDFGCLGYIRDHRPFFYNFPLKLHTTQTVFNTTELQTLPKIPIVYFYVDATPEILDIMLEHSDGLIIAGAGSGEISNAWIKELKALSSCGKPVVVTSRIDSGIVINNNLPENCITGDTLNPQKARILLMLALTKTKNIERIRQMFTIY